MYKCTKKDFKDSCCCHLYLWVKWVWVFRVHHGGAPWTRTLVSRNSRETPRLTSSLTFFPVELEAVRIICVNFVDKWRIYRIQTLCNRRVTWCSMVDQWKIRAKWMGSAGIRVCFLATFSIDFDVSDVNPYFVIYRRKMTPTRVLPTHSGLIDLPLPFVAGKINHQSWSKW